MSATHSSKTTAASVDCTEDLPSSSSAETESMSLGDEEDAEEEDDIPDDTDEPEEDLSEGEEWQNGPSRARNNRADEFEVPSSRGQERYREELLFHIEKIQKTMEESARGQSELTELLMDRLKNNPVQNTRSDWRVEMLEGRVKRLEDKVADLETEVMEMRWQNSALEANVKLLMEERTRDIVDRTMTPYLTNLQMPQTW